MTGQPQARSAAAVAASDGTAALVEYAQVSVKTTAERAMMRAVGEPAWVLAVRPWSETSLIAELLTSRFGRVPVVVKGARRSYSRYRGLINAFTPLRVNFAGRGEVKNLTDAKWIGLPCAPEGDALLTGYYVNELVLRLTVREDPLPALFDAYGRVLGAVCTLTGAELQAALRNFEILLLETLGWGQGAKKALTERTCLWRLEDGELVPSEESVQGSCVSHEAARAIISGTVTRSSPLKEIRQVLRSIIGYYVGPKTLATRTTAAAWNDF
ncbi:MAG: DNA repair protein RecO [Duodenibacillus sp.]